MSVALVITAKNEERLLRHNVNYHHYCGVERIYVFLDGSTDGTAASLEDLDFVQVSPSVEKQQVSPDLRDHPIIREAIHQYERHHCARQILNFCHATKVAQQEGHEWLISLDADELVCPADSSQMHGSIRTLIDHTTTADAILFKPIEVLPRQLEYNNVFSEERLFSSVFPSEGILDSPSVHFERPMLDPIRNEVRNVVGYLGHTIGKSAVRLSRPVFPKDVHQCAASDGPLRTTTARWLLHYNTYCYSDFLKKYRAIENMPNYWVSGGAVPYFPYQMWKETVNSGRFSEEELKIYYEKTVLVTDDKLDDLRQPNAHAVIEVDQVARVFSALEENTANG